MKELFEQYGGAILTVVAFVALGIMLKTMIGTDSTSPVYQAFYGLLDKMSGIPTE